MLASLSVVGGVATTSSQPPKTKMTTPIPPEVTTPDTVETRLGILNFKNGMLDTHTETRETIANLGSQSRYLGNIG